MVVQSVQTSTGPLDSIRVEGQARNTGSVMTYFDQVVIELHDTDNDVMDRDFAFVRGSRLQLPSGVVTDSALAPGQIGDYLNFHPFESKYLGRAVTWTAWEEADVARTATESAVTRWQDMVGSALENIAIGSREQRTRTRADAVERLRLLSLGPQAPSAAASVAKEHRDEYEISRRVGRK